MMSNLPVPNYYNQLDAKERSYVDFLGATTRYIGSEIERNTDKQIAANAVFAGELNSTLISNQIATEDALYHHTQQIDGRLIAGFSGVSSQLQMGFSDVSGHLQSGFSVVSRQLGVMGAVMNTGLALLNSTVQESSKDICNKLDTINDTLKSPLYTESRELYNRAFQSYMKGLFEEALEDLHEAIKKNKTDPFTHFLLGQTYLYGISEFCNVIDLNAAIEAFRNAAKYITYDAKTYKEAKLMAAEIWFYLGLAYHSKANDDLHNSIRADYEKCINEAKAAYGKSWDYSPQMLEARYNRARCKTFLGDIQGALEDLYNIIGQDSGYISKVSLDSDFDSIRGAFDEFVNSYETERQIVQYNVLVKYIDSTKNVILQPDIKGIGEKAFHGCSITGITIPSSVTSIGVCAFWGCSNIKNITIPSSVNYIGDLAFWGCNSLTSVILSRQTELGKDVFPPHTEIIYVD
jgi:tetratricopeptide (TPR) repeat protein